MTIAEKYQQDKRIMYVLFVWQSTLANDRASVKVVQWVHYRPPIVGCFDLMLLFENPNLFGNTEFLIPLA